ncbi:MAG: hypothetical protein IT448_09795 [Phycisphaerales bacterium]|nr:hypothetical protein [Phycisphaerales bacterium]
MPANLPRKSGNLGLTLDNVNCPASQFDQNFYNIAIPEQPKSPKFTYGDMGKRVVPAVDTASEARRSRENSAIQQVI